MSKRSRRKRESDLRRRHPHRAENRVYLVVCEGQTEKYYFDSMRKHPSVRVHTVRARMAKHPQKETVVSSAAQAQGDDYTEVWAVFDTDGANITDLLSRARRDGIEVVPSVPTFETWLILHLVDHRAALMSGKQAEKTLKSLLPEWSKGRTCFGDFADGPGDALSRAASLPEGTDPNTGIHRLVQTLLQK